MRKYYLEKANKFQSAFQNLFNIYAHELSEYNKWLDTQIDLDGNYLANEIVEYLNNDLKESYVIFREKHPIGFVVFSYPDANNDDGCTCYIEELFITKPNRKSGIASELAKDFWEKQNGVCGLCILKKNIIAKSFWENLLKTSNYTYTQEDSGSVWFYKIVLR